MTIKDKLSKVADIVGNTLHKATVLDLHYVVCIWESPVSKQLEYRVGYFEDPQECILFSSYLDNTYKEMAPYYIASDIRECNVDGGLLKELI